jgi:hypothetical protein
MPLCVQQNQESMNVQAPLWIGRSNPLCVGDFELDYTSCLNEIMTDLTMLSWNMSHYQM